MDIVRCLDPHCTRANEHATQPDGRPWCDQQKCPGCLPWPAADGINLCAMHRRKLGDNIERLAGLWADLEIALSSGGDGTGDKVSGGSVDPSIGVNLAVADHRAEIRATLVSWAKLVMEERGFAAPADTIPGICAFLGGSAEWLAAHTEAGGASQAMRMLADRAWQLTHPTGTRTITIGPCPQDGCEGEVRAVMRRDDSALPSEAVCTADGEHRWAASQWHALGRDINRARLVDTATLAEALGISTSQVRKLAAKGRLTSVGVWATVGAKRPSQWFDLDAATRQYAGVSP